jgi:hypothetical protein
MIAPATPRLSPEKIANRIRGKRNCRITNWAKSFVSKGRTTESSALIDSFRLRDAAPTEIDITAQIISAPSKPTVKIIFRHTNLV